MVSRDPFGRFTMFRKSVFSNTDTCAYCGNVRKTKNGRKYLYQYGIEKDGTSSSLEFQKEKFCCIDCMRSYQ